TGVYVLQKRDQEASRALNELWPIRQYLRDPLMQRLVDYSIKSIRTRLGPMTAGDWDTWLNEIKEEASINGPQDRP
ncbi:MAG TPA: hypothetical protein PL064_13160, partial [Thermogutta sp.]|nr:hypothetical protein [Thermogutta sp.]